MPAADRIFVGRLLALSDTDRRTLATVLADAGAS
jgi:hypothetical protein